MKKLVSDGKEEKYGLPTPLVYDKDEDKGKKKMLTKRKLF